MIKITKFKIISSLLISFLFLQTSCGYVLHKERRNQSHSGNLDIAIVALDTIGLLFFIIPGVIAFAVDIHSNTIYLPKGANDLSSLDNSKNITIRLDKKLSKTAIEKIVKENTGKDITLNDETITIGSQDLKMALLN